MKLSGSVVLYLVQILIPGTRIFEKVSTSMQRICKENQSELITSEYQHLIDYIDISDFYKHSGSDQGQRCFAIVFLVFLTRFRLTNLICTSLQVLMWRTAFIFVCLQRFSISVKSYASLFRWQVQELHRFMLSLMTFLLCYNHGQRSWDTFAFLGRFPIHTGPTPPLTPQTMLDACIQNFFRVSTLYRVGGGRTARKFRK